MFTVAPTEALGEEAKHETCEIPAASLGVLCGSLTDRTVDHWNGKALAQANVDHQTMVNSMRAQSRLRLGDGVHWSRALWQLPQFLLHPASRSDLRNHGLASTACSVCKRLQEHQWKVAREANDDNIIVPDVQRLASHSNQRTPPDTLDTLL
jgi:hypothetical protein